MVKIKKKDNSEKLQHSSLLIDGILVGIFAGVVGLFYRYLISLSEKVIYFFEYKIDNSLIWTIMLLFFLVMVGFISAIMVKKEPYSAGSGIPQVTAEVTGRITTNPLKIIIYKILGGFSAALGGLSLGREGPSIQLGAMAGKYVSKILKRDSIKENYLITCGASAGLSVAFNAPLAGVLFSIEEIHKNVSKKLIVSCFSAAVVADVLSQYVFGVGATFEFPNLEYIKLSNYFYFILLGIFLGLCGTLYNILMKNCYFYYNKLNLPLILRPQVAILVSFCMFLMFPIVLGSGHNLVEKLLITNYSLLFLLLLYLIKMIFSLISFTSGVAGGIFLPILVQGAILGSLFSKLISSDNIALYIILAMAGYLTAVVRSPLTSIVLIFEMTQKLNYFLPLAICCLAAYFTANILGTKPVYEYLLNNLLAKEKVIINDETEIEIELTIEADNKNIYKKIKNINWGEGVFVANIERNGKNIIPKGETQLQLNDKLTIYVTKENSNEFVTNFLEK